MASDRRAVRRCGHVMRWARSYRVLQCDGMLSLSPAAAVAARKCSAMPFPERVARLTPASRDRHEIRPWTPRAEPGGVEHPAECRLGAHGAPAARSVRSTA